MALQAIELTQYVMPGADLGTEVWVDPKAVRWLSVRIYNIGGGAQQTVTTVHCSSDGYSFQLDVMETPSQVLQKILNSGN